jgi:hypothetical protein
MPGAKLGVAEIADYAGFTGLLRNLLHIMDRRFPARIAALDPHQTLLVPPSPTRYRLELHCAESLPSSKPGDSPKIGR